MPRIMYYISIKQENVGSQRSLFDKIYLRRERLELHLKLRKTPQMQSPTDFQKGRLLSHRRIAGNIEQKQLPFHSWNPSKCTKHAEQFWDCSQPYHSLRST